MKKILVVVGILSIVVLAVGAAGFAYAKSQTPKASEYPFGPGMMGAFDGDGRGFGHGMMDDSGGGYGRGMMGWDGEYGPMHDAMVSALAEALDLTTEEVETRHDGGETLWQIAAAEGRTDEEIREVMLAAHDIALEDAVANGLLTEEQAKWMDAHMEQMWSGDYEGGGFGGHCGSGWQNDNSRLQGENQ
jgi:hypothetical protein